MSRLNDKVPYQTMIRVLLRKIKLQEEEIERLRNEQCDEYLDAIIEGLTMDEKKAMTSNPMYKRLKLEFNNLRDKYSRMKDSEEMLINRLAVATRTIDDWFTK